MVVESRQLPVELGGTEVAEVPKEGVEVTDTEEEASEMRTMQPHLTDARNRGPGCPSSVAEVGGVEPEP